MNVFKMIDFIGTKNPDYTYEKVESNLPVRPIKDKGYMDDNGKQGEWFITQRGDKFIGSYKNNKRDGYWEGYYPNGQIGVKGFYKDGKEDGIWEEYNDNGELWYKALYKNGKFVKNLLKTKN